MSEVDEEEEEKDDDEPGFLLRLPFGLGWMRGDGAHLTAILPVVRWIVVGATVIYLVGRVVEDIRR